MKQLEKRLNDYVSLLIYASIEDIKRDWNGPAKYSSMTYQSYSNLMKDKKDRGDRLVSIFTIADQSKQCLAFFFNKMVEEVNCIDVISENDEISEICKKAVNANSECYFEFMVTIADRHRDYFGSTLEATGDTSLWFHNMFVERLPLYATKQRICANISTVFDKFLKSIAWLCSKLFWYHKMPLSVDLLFGILAQQGLNQLMLDLIYSSFRPKPVAAKKKGVKKAQQPKDKGAAQTGAETAAVDMTEEDTEIANLIAEIDI